MSTDFLAWYDEKYPESRWDIDNQMVYDSWLEYLSREQHKRMLYETWCAATKHRWQSTFDGLLAK